MNDNLDDIFATLFTPPTPRASPSHTPDLGYSGSRQVRHSRTDSTDSEFGAFVSVPPSEDPLHLGRGPEPAPFTPLHNFFDKFTEDAKAASEKKRRQVLDELLQHEDDPLYWLQDTTSSVVGSSQDLDIPSNVSFGEPLIDLDDPLDSLSQPTFTDSTRRTSPLPHSLQQDLLEDDWQDAAQPRQPHRTDQVPQPLVQLSYFPGDAVLVQSNLLDDAWKSTTPIDQSDHPHRRLPSSFEDASPHTSAQQGLLVDLDSPQDKTPPSRPRHHGDHVRSPSLPPPPSPARPSHPEIQRTESTYVAPPSIPSRWVSSLLSSTIRGPRMGTPPSGSLSVNTPPEFSSRFATFSRSAPHSRTATASTSVSEDAAITHGTPFASQPYIPSSGAPGFAGDRQWDKGFEFDVGQVERKSVRLVGRREMTTPVLTVVLADMIRTFLPALARLPKTWTLLYSLDQNGISLNTLYARCQDFKGSALVVVRDAGEALFGAWMGEGIRPSKGAYYGSGESFLWQRVDKDRVRVFKWTGRNDYVALCEPEYFSFGGGDGRYGLWLDSTLTDGSSARCPTFDNEPLCSAGGPRQGDTVTFECVGLEVWGIG